VLTHNRLSNLELVQPTSDTAAALAHSEDRIGALLVEMHRHIGSEQEATLVTDTAAAVRGYVRARERVNATERDANVAVIRIAPDVERATERIQELGALNQLQVTAAQQRAERTNIVANVLGAVSVAAVVLWGVMMLFARKLIFRPLTALTDAMHQFRFDRPTAAPVENAPVEIRTVAESFNEMSETIMHQRHLQMEFLAGVAHDLRSPLATVSMGLDRLVHTPVERMGEAARSLLPLLTRQIDRINRMIADLLDVTAVNSGKLALDLADVDLRAIVADGQERHAADSPIHPIRVSLPDAPVPVRADRARLDQVLDNLVSNAIRYSPVGGDVALELVTSAGEAVVSVADQGVGIAPEQKAGIFQPFRRLDQTGGVPGLGIGLTVARRIVEAHGGQIEVESERGRGSTFRVRLPRRSS
jgi:signal transduction histidine kinase